MGLFLFDQDDGVFAISPVVISLTGDSQYLPVGCLKAPTKFAHGVLIDFELGHLSALPAFASRPDCSVSGPVGFSLQTRAQRNLRSPWRRRGCRVSLEPYLD